MPKLGSKIVDDRFRVVIPGWSMPWYLWEQVKQISKKEGIPINQWFSKEFERAIIIWEKQKIDFFKSLPANQKKQNSEDDFEF